MFDEKVKLWLKLNKNEEILMFWQIKKIKMLQKFVNITLFLAFLSGFLISCYSYLKNTLAFFLASFFTTIDVVFKIEWFLNFFCFYFDSLSLTTESDPRPKFSLSYSLIISFLLPKILCWLPDSDSDSDPALFIT